MLNPRIKKQLIEVASHPLIIKAIKDVYSLKGVGHRKGEFDRDLAIGMLKNAVNIIKKEGTVNQEAYVEKIVEFLKKSGARGKGARVNNLDDLPAEVLFDINKKWDEPEEPEVPQPTKQQPTPTPTPEPEEEIEPEPEEEPINNIGDEDMTQPNEQTPVKPLKEEALENIITVWVNVDDTVDMSKVEAIASAHGAYLSQKHPGVLDFSMDKPKVDPDSKYLNPYEAFKQELLKVPGVTKVEADLVQIDEDGGAGVVSAAGAGCGDGTVNQAPTGGQGIAIKPSKIGLGLTRRKIEEETGCPDFSKMYAFNRTGEETEDRREENCDRRESFLGKMRKRIQSLLEDIEAGVDVSLDDIDDEEET